MANTSGNACRCEIQDSKNWEIIGIAGVISKSYIMKCVKCNAKWYVKSKNSENINNEVIIKE